MSKTAQNKMRAMVYKDGVSVKHIKNRRVSVFTSKNGCVIIEFAKADVSKENITIPCSVNIVIKNKVQVTGIPLSKEAALGLYACLNYYFTEIDKYSLNKTHQ